jgi:xanthine dehydrogenase accessory factor
MKQWLETRQILERWQELRRGGQAAALATVVRVRGSAYRRPGAKLLVAADGSSVGNVSGGCLEEDVREVALRVIESGRAELRSYCSGADPVDAWDLGVGCEGEVEVFVRPLRVGLAALHARLAGDEPFAFCSLCREGDGGAAEGLLVSAEGVGGTLGDDALDAMAVRVARSLPEGEPSGLHQVAGHTVFIDRFLPPPRLIVCGAGDDARPVVRLALDAGFGVTVVDRRPALLDPSRFPAAAQLVLTAPAGYADRNPTSAEQYALLMTHSFADDVAWASVLGRRPLRYLGILGPRARTERLLRTAGLQEMEEDPRLFGPVGLDVGTEGAEQVAISILAELLAVQSGRAGGSLRDRCVPIHAGAG